MTALARPWPALCRARIGADGPAWPSKTASVAGLNLLDVLAGHDRVLIIDVVQTGRAVPGTLIEWPIERASAGRTLGGSHQTDLATTIALGRALGHELPESIRLLVAEAEDLLTVREGLTRDVAAAVPIAAEMARVWVETGALPATAARRSDPAAS